MLIEEAKKKICPLNNVVSWEGAKATMCSADQCMAWRWNHEDTSMVIGETVEGIKILTNGERIMSKTDGYCDLVGKAGAE